MFFKLLCLIVEVLSYFLHFPVGLFFLSFDIYAVVILVFQCLPHFGSSVLLLAHISLHFIVTTPAFFIFRCPFPC